MNKILEIILGTPWWVWLLFGFLIYRGVKALKSSVIPITTILIVPFIFFCLSLQGLFSRYGLQTYPWAIWISTLFIGILLGWLIIRGIAIRADKKKRLIKLPGTRLTLFLMLIFFGIRYYYGYTAEVNPDLLQTISFITARFTLSGLNSGFFIGRMFHYLYKYKKAKHTDLA